MNLVSLIETCTRGNQVMFLILNIRPIKILILCLQRFKNQLYFNSINKKYLRINLHAQTALCTEKYRIPQRKIRYKYMEVYNVYGLEPSILLTHNFFHINLLLQYSANHNPSQLSCNEKQISFLPSLGTNHLSIKLPYL